MLIIEIVIVSTHRALINGVTYNIILIIYRIILYYLDTAVIAVTKIKLCKI